MRIERAARAIVEADERPSRPRGQLVHLRDLEDVEGDTLIDGLLLPDSLSALWGPSNAGKTAIAHDLAVACATGARWCNRRCTAVPVAVLAYEGRWGLRRRLDAACHARGVQDLAALQVFVYSDPPSLADGDGLAALRSELARLGIRVVIIDTLAAACAGVLDIDSGAGGDASRAVAALRSILPPGAAVIVIHHCGHDDTRMRGAYSFVAAIDTELHAADGILRTRKQRDLPSDLRVAYRLVPAHDSITVEYDAAPVAIVRDDLRGRIADVLRASPHASASEVLRRVGGNRQRVFNLCRELRATSSSGSGTVPVPVEPGIPTGSSSSGSKEPELELVPRNRSGACDE